MKTIVAQTSIVEQIEKNKVMTIDTFKCLSEQFAEYLGITVSVEDVAQMQKMRKLCTIKSIMERQNVIYAEIDLHLADKHSVATPPLISLLGEIHDLSARLKDEKIDMETYRYIAENYNSYCSIKNKETSTDEPKS